MLWMLLACVGAPDVAVPETEDALTFAPAGALEGAAAQAVRLYEPRSLGLGGPDTGGDTATGETGDTALADTGVAACDSAWVDSAYQDAASELGVTTYAYLPPIIDLRGTNSAWRQAAVLGYEPDGSCFVLAEFSESDSMDQASGFGALHGSTEYLIDPSGLMARQVVSSSGELWFFFNTIDAFWRVDPSTGATTRDDSLGERIIGAVEDGAGGAWVVTAPVFSADGTLSSGRELVRLGPTGTALGAGAALPFTDVETGFASAVNNAATLRAPMFLATDLALGPSGALWMLDSESGELATYSGASFSTPVSTGLRYPTSLAWASAQLVMVTGLVTDEDGAALELPALHTWDVSTSTATLQLELSEPADGWAENGFASQVSTSDRLMRQIWFDISEPRTGALVVSDPGHQRVLWVE